MSAAMTDEAESSFRAFRPEIDQDQQIRESVREITRELEDLGRDQLALLQKAHPPTDTKDLFKQANERFQQIKVVYLKLSVLVPGEQYYKYHDQFRWVTQRMAFLASFLVFLQTGQLATRDNVADLLGVHAQRSDGFHLDLEDYLCGLLQLSSELARFTVNCVTVGDYAQPMAIHAFLVQLDAGFRLLNFKNDNLRKKFDALKYDMQKVENVVYDLSIRGLKADTDATAAVGASD